MADSLSGLDDLDSQISSARQLRAGERNEERSPEPLEPAKDEEGVFEIRDFTTVTTFERLSQQISLATKHWAQALPDSSEVLQMRDSFELGGFRYSLLFQLVPLGETKKEDRLGLHAFPTRAHRLQRWFGVRHFLILSIDNHNIDLDSARTLLSAAVLAIATVPIKPQLSVFVPVEGGRKVVLGEAICGARTIYCTDLHFSVQPSLEHLAGLSEFFRKKVELADEEKCTMMIGVRFTYSADDFEVPEGEEDAIESMKLHCLWPAFPLGAFGDDATFSELDPRSAPYWKLRLLRGETPTPLLKRLQTLLSFRREAKQIRSAEQSMQAQVPKTAMASLTAAIQESLESILLPTAGEMFSMTEQCLALPVVPKTVAPMGALACGARRQGRLVHLACLAAQMRCFKGAVMLWCSVLGRMRQQWDSLEAPADAVTPPTHCVGARGTRSEFFDPSMCLAQQKMELWQRSIQNRLRRDRCVASGEDFVGPAGRACVAPAVLCPALLTEDQLLQRDTASSSMEPREKAELDGKELRSDMAAFKAANASADCSDFLRWREVQGLSAKVFPVPWLEKLWEETEPMRAQDQQQRLFEPLREAEMALHYLESIEGPQLLLQIFRVLLRDTVEELSERMQDVGSPTYLRVLRDRAISTSSQAFRKHGEAEEVDVQASQEEFAEFPPEEQLQSILAALEAWESSTRLAYSIHAKLGEQTHGLLEDLLAEGEVDITQPDQRLAIENVFESSHWLKLSEERDARKQRPAGVFESLPLAKEFVLQLQPLEGMAAPKRRMYAEVRENHMRLALVREMGF